MALVQNQLKKWGHLKELNACAAARVSANVVNVSSVQTVWRHLMVLKKQNGMQRGRAVILAACICTGWVRFSGCLLGRGKVGKKNGRVNVLAHCSLCVPSPLALQDTVLLNASSVLLQARGKKGVLAGGGWAVAACEKMGQTRFGACGCRWLVGRGQNQQFPLFHIICPSPLLHSFLCAFTSPVLVQDKVCRKPRLALKAAAKGEKFSISSISSIRDFFPVTW